MEFEYEEVAKIAAEAMDNYLMYDKLLQCELTEVDQLFLIEHTLLR